jgi:carboxylesterase type B
LISGNTRAEVGLYPALIGLPNIAFDFIHDPGFPSGFMFANARLAIHSSFACGAGNAVRAHRQAGLKAWRYEYAGEFPNLNISVQGGGSYHSSEVPLVFGSSEHGLKMADTEEEKKLGQQIRTAWTTFAKNPKQGLEKLGWPLYDNKSEWACVHFLHSSS